ncbi:MAG: PEP-CTERM sorting domain-containing protein [Verrucomicrobiae bacterium]|nr:PEP-CTERM sorting domain-containing protein [Verrucomicrobiae bacterium]
MNFRKAALLASVSTWLLLPAAHAGLVFSDNLSSSANWTVLGDADTDATFGYDYSADGIPAAPNGADTIGLKLQANITSGTVATVAAVRSTGISGTPYRVSFDVWSNYAIAGAGTTEFAGGGVGHDGVTAGLNGASLLVTGDGGSSRDIRLYKGGSEQFIESLQYNPAFATNNGSEPAIAAAIVGTAPPVGQAQTGTASNGAAAFQWITMFIDVDPTAGQSTFTLSAGGNTLEIGTIDSNIGDPVAMDGGVALIYSDLFASLADTPSLQFGVYDNVTVETIPEPSVAALLGFCGLGFLVRRRRA